MQCHSPQAMSQFMRFCGTTKVRFFGKRLLFNNRHILSYIRFKMLTYNIHIARYYATPDEMVEVLALAVVCF